MLFQIPKDSHKSTHIPYKSNDPVKPGRLLAGMVFLHCLLQYNEVIDL